MILEFKWTVSKARDTYGYNICTLYVNGRKSARCNGGGYDMQGTCLGNWLASHYAERLRQLTPNGKERLFYGLSYHDPNFDPGKAVPNDPPVFGNEEDQGKTVEQLEKEGKSLGLERYQQFYSASSPYPTERHTIPLINGGVGLSSVQDIGVAIGLSFRYVPVRSKNLTIYEVSDTKEQP